MTTSRTGLLSKPKDGERIPAASLAYMRARAKRHAYDLVLQQFKNSGISKAEIARRLGKGNPEISRMLGGPANWTIRTMADLLFAISGSAPTFAANQPLEKPKRNFTRWDQFSGLAPRVEGTQGTNEVKPKNIRIGALT